ncbi:bacteriocin-protection, YdeI or OmpD-associated-domain-containing protein [Podospora didyma]|uniref:Bacteriocin-protection, YdeI or OmpD-associated-domain-containing protein n=1 Tax=Podospora didyma TaxID=330526 RepID=A0AAE0N3H3_9PEZI|nr:bacteriocin-protection, YdeI or OmpD-associated-domain-containing protein [Podospora didyma]
MSRRLRSAAKAVQAVTESPAVSTAPAAPAAPSPALGLAIQLFEDASAWESWLETHHHTETAGLWLKLSKKASGIVSVTYDEAIDAALCFGWIDGQRKSHDEQHFLQRFTPRRGGSMWSKRNVEKVGVLIEAGRMRPPGQAEINAAKADGRWDRAYSSSSVMQVPADFQKALDKNKKAGAYFDTLNKSKRYSFLWRIETAKRAETRQRRIDQFIGLLAKHKTL